MGASLIKPYSTRQLFVASQVLIIEFADDALNAFFSL